MICMRYDVPSAAEGAEQAPDDLLADLPAHGVGGGVDGLSRGSCFLRLEVDRLEAEGRRGGACRYARSRSRCSRSQAAC